MRPSFRTTLAVIAALAVFAESLQGQSHPRPILPAAEVEEISPSSIGRFEAAERLLRQGAWSEAIDGIRNVAETEPGRLVPVPFVSPREGFTRYVSAREYCQWRLAALASDAPEALRHYRELIDPQAEEWFRQAEATNDEGVYARLVSEAFASHRGDDALLRLGDLALSRGDYAGARRNWRRIERQLNVPPPLGARQATLGSYGDSDLDLAGVAARLVLVSIVEGATNRARHELAQFGRIYPIAAGPLAGHTGLYVDTLSRLLDQSAEWPAPRTAADWPTFAKNAQRLAVTHVEVQIAEKPLWAYSLPLLRGENNSLSYHPVVVGNDVLVRTDVNGRSLLICLDLKSGRERWKVDYSRGLAPHATEDQTATNSASVNDVYAGIPRPAGAVHYTMTASGDRVFARMGSPITAPTPHRASIWLRVDQGFLLGVSRTSEGKPLEGFPLRPPSAEWSFEGPPICTDGTIYFAMRRGEAGRSQLYLMAVDLPTVPLPPVEDSMGWAARLKWRLRLGSFESGVSGADEITHLLLSNEHGRLYLNTNGGVVAAVNANNGELLWLTKYPRAAAAATAGQPPLGRAHGEMSPCMVYQERVIVAPCDCDQVFALDSLTGEVAWTLGGAIANDVAHLIGVQDDTFIASGRSLYWIDVHTGKVLAQSDASSMASMGRGLIAGDTVWSPTRESVEVFSMKPAFSANSTQPRAIRSLPLKPYGIAGGNLVLASGVLLIAGDDKLVAFKIAPNLEP